MPRLPPHATSTDHPFGSNVATSASLYFIFAHADFLPRLCMDWLLSHCWLVAFRNCEVHQFSPSSRLSAEKAPFAQSSADLVHCLPGYNLQYGSNLVIITTWKPRHKFENSGAWSPP
jgi:hypothetical protein